MPEYDNAYYIDRFGLALLLNRKGLKRIYCLDIFGNDVEIEDEEACRSLFSMASEELVNVDENEEFFLSEDFDRICDLITGAKIVIAIYSYSSQNTCDVIYAGEESAVCAQPAKNRKDTLKVFEIESNSIDDYIREIIQSSECKKEETPLFAESLEFLALNDSFVELAKNPATDIVVDFILPEAGMSYQKCAVINVVGKKELCVWKNDGFLIKEYDNNNIYKDFRREL